MNLASRRIKQFGVVGFAISCMILQAAWGATCNFVASSGSWQTSGNWDCGTVPDGDDTAIIGVSGTVSVDAPVVVGALTLTSGTLQNNSNIDVTTQWVWGGGTVTGNGTLTNEGTADINASVTLSGPLVNAGTVNVNGAFTIALPLGGSIDNQLNASFNMVGDGVVGSFSTATTFTNTGTFTKTAGGGNGIIDAVINSTGTVAVDAGTLLFRNNASLDGTATAASGAAFNFDFLSQTLETGLDLDADTVTFGSTGTDVVDTTDYTVTTTVINGTTSFNGASYTLPNLNQPGGTLQGDGDIDVTTQWNWDGGTLTGDGTLTNEGTGSINASVTLSRPLVNTGTVSLNGTASMAMTAGASMNNELNASFNIVGDGTVGSFNTATVFTNAGTFTKTAGSGNGIIDAVFNSTGTVAVDTGTLLLRNNASLDGTATAASGAAFNFDFLSQTLEARLDMDADTVTFGSNGTDVVNTSNYTVTTTVINGTTTFNGANYTLPNLNQLGGTLQGDGNISVTTQWTWGGGTLTGDGMLTNEGSGDINASVTLSRSLVNTGSVNLNGTATLTMPPGGSVDNLLNASFNIVGDGTVGSFNTATVFTNSGVLTKTAGGGNGIIDAVFNSTGTVAVDTGTLLLRNNSSLDGTATAASGAGFSFDFLSQTLETGLDLDADTVTFGSTGTDVVDTTDFTVTTTVINGTTNFNGASYTLPNLNQLGGALQGDGDIDVTTQWNWNGGVIASGGMLTNSGAGNINASVTLSRPLVNTGTVNLNGTATLAMPAGGSVDNQPNASFNIVGDGTVGTFNTATVFTNAGTITKTAGSGNGIIDAVFNSTGTVAVDTGTLLLRNNASLDGTATAASGAAFNFDFLSQTLETGLALDADTVTFGSTGTDTVSSKSATVGTININGDINLNGNLLVVNRDFNRIGGSVFNATGMVSFLGAAEQQLNVTTGTVFHDLMVGAGSTLVETMNADNASVAGMLFNDGIIRKTKAVSGVGVQTFGLTSVELDVLEAGTLSMIQIDRMDNGPVPIDYRQQDLTYWDIAPTGSDFVVDLSLAHNLQERDTDALACQFNVVEWNCARSFSNPEVVTLEDVTDLSRWTTGDGALILVDDFEGFYIAIPEEERP